MRREAKAALFRETCGERGGRRRTRAAPRNPRGHGRRARGARRRAGGRRVAGRAAELRRVADAAAAAARKASLGATKRIVVEPVSVTAPRAGAANLDRLAGPEHAGRRQGVVDQATKAGVSEDAPELPRGRQPMHRLKLDEARAIVKEATSVIPETRRVLMS